jgi:predicted nucleic acid-binding protein
LIERAVLLDTGPLVALLTASDAHHQRCVETLASLKPPLLTCWQVITEAAWLLRKQIRPLDRVSEAHAAGVFRIVPLDGDDLAAIAEIMGRYEDIGLQLADAALVHLAQREGVHTVFTTDRRDFTIIRLKRNRSLQLIPDMP